MGGDLLYAYPVIKHGIQRRAEFNRARRNDWGSGRRILTGYGMLTAVEQLPYTAPGLTWRHGCSGGMEADESQSGADTLGTEEWTVAAASRETTQSRASKKLFF